MGIDYNVISAWAAVIAALAAVVAIWIDGKRTRFSQGLDLVIRYREAFDAEEFKKKRRTIAKLLLKEGDQKWFEQGKRLEAAEDILNHFQLIGYLRRRGILDKEFVWAEYYYWLTHYHHLLKLYVAAVREWEPSAWEDVDWLYEDLTSLERKNRPKGSDIGPTDETLREFLFRESNL